MSERIHLGIGHYGIGNKDGVNTVIARNVRALSKIDPEMKITLFGKLSEDYEDFIKPLPEKVNYRNIDEFDADIAAVRLRGKSVVDQQVHDYVWMGTDLAEVLVDRLEDMDVVMIENLGIGIQPYVTYAFFLYTEFIYTRGINKKFIYRCHDFVQQRPANFRNIKKFHHSRFGVVPHWHSILYPSYSNIKYVAINRYDRWRLLEHGIEEDNIYYIPNSIDPSIVPPDDQYKDLRKRIIEEENLDPSVRFINCLSEVKLERNNCRLRQTYHLLVSLTPASGDDAVYAEKLAGFIKANKLPVTIGLNELISLDRETDASDPSRLVKYSIGDLYSVSDLVITTSVLEGFGFSYIEPWLVNRAVIGRSIPFLTPDFQAAGMKLGHLYSALIVDGHDFKDIGSDKADPDRSLEERLKKILKLNDPAYLRRFIDRNETAVIATCPLFDEEKRYTIIKVNKQVVKKSYSQETIGKQLYKVITSK